MPMPPTHCKKVRHTFMDTGNASSPVSTVDPVVVRPDTASKYAWVNDMGRPISWVTSISGSAANSGSSTQTSVTSITPWRGCSSRRNRRSFHHRPQPTARVAAMATG
ncbi:hypothetical protein D3C71_1343750 [compost metagenome]